MNQSNAHLQRRLGAKWGQNASKYPLFESQKARISPFTRAFFRFFAYLSGTEFRYSGPILNGIVRNHGQRDNGN